MLAIFNKSVMICPEELKHSPSPESESEPESEAYSAWKDDSLLQRMASLIPEAVTVNLAPKGFLAFNSAPNDLPFPRTFTSVDGVFCIFQGRIDNVAQLKKRYGLTGCSDGSRIIMESYLSFRDRHSAPYPPHMVVSLIEGDYAFILYDKYVKNTFVGVDANGSIPLYWGADKEENVVVSLDIEIVKKACGDSFGPFPTGCFYLLADGVRMTENPWGKLIAVPWNDAIGEPSGVSFIIDENGPKMPEILIADSDDSWLSDKD